MGEHGFWAWSRIGQDATVTYGVYALGGAILACVLISSWRLRVLASVTLGWLALLLYVSQRHSNPITGHYWTDFAAVTGLAAAIAVVLSLWFSLPGLLGRRFRAWTRRAIVPAEWSPASPPLPSRELVTRWFVAVTAATTGATFYQMAEPSFWAAAVHALRPERIIYTVLIVLVPLVVVGPVEEYVLDRGTQHGAPRDDSKERAIEQMWRNFSWRAFGRLLVVLAVVFQLTVFHASFDETVGRGKLAASDLLAAGFGPGLLSYYWAAALQTGQLRIARRVTLAVSVATLLFNLPAQWVGACIHFILDASAGGRIALFLDRSPSLQELSLADAGKAIALGLLLGTAIAGGLAVVAAAQAWLGGRALRGVRGAWPLAILFGLLMLAIGLPLIAEHLVLWGLGEGEVRFVQGVWAAALTSAGAALGLALSGFPQIVTRARFLRS